MFLTVNIKRYSVLNAIFAISKLSVTDRWLTLLADNTLSLKS